MIIAIGSTNPAKVKAVEAAFQARHPDASFEFVPVAADSGISDQPMDNAETIQGARNRAAAALQAQNVDFGVGIEGGLENIDDAWFSKTWVVVRSSQGKEGIGSSIAMSIPDNIMALIRNGQELSEATDTVFKATESGKKQGFVGLMSDNAITRASSTQGAVIAAISACIYAEAGEEE